MKSEDDEIEIICFLASKPQPGAENKNLKDADSVGMAKFKKNYGQLFSGKNPFKKCGA